MEHNFSQARVIDENGVIELLYTKLDDEGKPVLSYPLVVTSNVVDPNLDDLARAWIEENAASIAPFQAPDLEALREHTRRDILFRLENLTNRVMSKYLPTDPIRWPAKEKEAKAFLAKAEGERSVGDAPEVSPAIIDANPTLSDAELLDRISAEMQDIVVNATRFRAIGNFTEKLRKETKPMIASAGDATALRQVSANAETAIQEFITLAGI